MHDGIVLVEGGVCCFFDDVLDDGLVGGGGVEVGEAVEGAAVGVVVDSIAGVAFGEELGECCFFSGVFVDEAEGGD